MEIMKRRGGASDRDTLLFSWRFVKIAMVVGIIGMILSGVSAPAHTVSSGLNTVVAGKVMIASVLSVKAKVTMTILVVLISLVSFYRSIYFATGNKDLWHHLKIRSPGMMDSPQSTKGFLVNDHPLLKVKITASNRRKETALRQILREVALLVPPEHVMSLKEIRITKWALLLGVLGGRSNYGSKGRLSIFWFNIPWRPQQRSQNMVRHILLHEIGHFYHGIRNRDTLNKDISLTWKNISNDWGMRILIKGVYIVVLMESIPTVLNLEPSWQIIVLLILSIRTFLQLFDLITPSGSFVSLRAKSSWKEDLAESYRFYVDPYKREYFRKRAERNKILMRKYRYFSLNEEIKAWQKHKISIYNLFSAPMGRAQNPAAMLPVTYWSLIVAFSFIFFMVGFKAALIALIIAYIIAMAGETAYRHVYGDPQFIAAHGYKDPQALQWFTSKNPIKKTILGFIQNMVFQAIYDPIVLIMMLFDYLKEKINNSKLLKARISFGFALGVVVLISLAIVLGKFVLTKQGVNPFGYMIALFTWSNIWMFGLRLWQNRNKPWRMAHWSQWWRNWTFTSTEKRILDETAPKEMAHLNINAFISQCAMTNLFVWALAGVVAPASYAIMQTAGVILSLFLTVVILGKKHGIDSEKFRVRHIFGLVLVGASMSMALSGMDMHSVSGLIGISLTVLMALLTGVQPVEQKYILFVLNNGKKERQEHLPYVMTKYGYRFGLIASIVLWILARYLWPSYAPHLIDVLGYVANPWVATLSLLFASTWLATYKFYVNKEPSLTKLTFLRATIPFWSMLLSLKILGKAGDAHQMLSGLLLLAAAIVSWGSIKGAKAVPGVSENSTTKALALTGPNREKFLKVVYSSIRLKSTAIYLPILAFGILALEFFPETTCIAPWLVIAVASILGVLAIIAACKSFILLRQAEKMIDEFVPQEEKEFYQANGLPEIGQPQRIEHWYNGHSSQDRKKLEKLRNEIIQEGNRYATAVELHIRNNRIWLREINQSYLMALTFGLMKINPSKALGISDLQSSISFSRNSWGILDEADRRITLAALLENDWDIPNTAKLLNNDTSTVRRKTMRYGLKNEALFVGSYRFKPVLEMIDPQREDSSDRIIRSTEMMRVTQTKEEQSLKESDTASRGACIVVVQDELTRLNDDELLAKAKELKKIGLNEGNTSLAIALFSESTRRIVNKHKNGIGRIDGLVVDYIGGPPRKDQIEAALSLRTARHLEVMEPSAGKTLTVALAAYLKVLSGHKVEVHDWSAHLSLRDAQIAGAVLEGLGVKVAALVNNKIYRFSNFRQEGAFTHLSESTAQNKILALQQLFHHSDIVYGPFQEMIFLWMNDWYESRKQVHDPSCPVWFLVEEADTPFLDEINDPLATCIADDLAPLICEIYKYIYEMAQGFEENVDYVVFKGRAYFVSIEKEQAYLKQLEEAIKALKANRIINHKGSSNGKLRAFLNSENLRDLILAAREAQVVFEQDEQYFVIGNQIIIRNEMTGEAQYGKFLSRGIHTFLEIKHIDEKQRSNHLYKVSQVMSTREFYNRVGNFSSVTGVLSDEDIRKLKNYYNIAVHQQPPTFVNNRREYRQYFFSQQDKFNRLIAIVKDAHKSGQPILIDSHSPIESLAIKKVLLGAHEQESFLKSVDAICLINGQNGSLEEKMWNSIGQAGRITIVAQAAGRGQEIRLEPNLYESVKSDIFRTVEGLLVIGTHRKMSERVERQLINRSARGGRFGISILLDHIIGNAFLNRYAQEELGTLLKDPRCFNFRNCEKIFELAQKRRELHQDETTEALSPMLNKLLQDQDHFAQWNKSFNSQWLRREFSNAARAYINQSYNCIVTGQKARFFSMHSSLATIWPQEKSRESLIGLLQNILNIVKKDWSSIMINAVSNNGHSDFVSKSKPEVPCIVEVTDNNSFVRLSTQLAKIIVQSNGTPTRLSTTLLRLNTELLSYSLTIAGAQKQLAAFAKDEDVHELITRRLFNQLIRKSSIQDGNTKVSGSESNAAPAMQKWLMDDFVEAYISGDPIAWYFVLCKAPETEELPFYPIDREPLKRWEYILTSIIWLWGHSFRWYWRNPFKYWFKLIQLRFKIYKEAQGDYWKAVNIHQNNNKQWVKEFLINVDRYFDGLSASPFTVVPAVVSTNKNLHKYSKVGILFINDCKKVHENAQGWLLRYLRLINFIPVQISRKHAPPHVEFNQTGPSAAIRSNSNSDWKNFWGKRTDLYIQKILERLQTSDPCIFLTGGLYHSCLRHTLAYLIKLIKLNNLSSVHVVVLEPAVSAESATVAEGRGALLKELIDLETPYALYIDGQEICKSRVIAPRVKLDIYSSRKSFKQHFNRQYKKLELSTAPAMLPLARKIVESFRLAALLFFITAGISLLFGAFNFSLFAVCLGVNLTIAGILFMFFNIDWQDYRRRHSFLGRPVWTQDVFAALHGISPDDLAQAQRDAEQFGYKDPTDRKTSLVEFIVATDPKRMKSNDRLKAHLRFDLQWYFGLRESPAMVGQSFRQDWQISRNFQLSSHRDYFDDKGFAFNEQGRRRAILNYQLAINEAVNWVSQNSGKDNFPLFEIKAVYGSFAKMRHTGVLPRLGLWEGTQSADLLNLKDGPSDIDLVMTGNLEAAGVKIRQSFAVLRESIYRRFGVIIQLWPNIKIEGYEAPISEFLGDGLIRLYQATLTAEPAMADVLFSKDRRALNGIERPAMLPLARKIVESFRLAALLFFITAGISLLFGAFNFSLFAVCLGVNLTIAGILFMFFNIDWQDYRRRHSFLGRPVWTQDVFAALHGISPDDLAQAQRDAEQFGYKDPTDRKTSLVEFIVATDPKRMKSNDRLKAHLRFDLQWYFGLRESPAMVDAASSKNNRTTNDSDKKSEKIIEKLILFILLLLLFLCFWPMRSNNPAVLVSKLIASMMIMFLAASLEGIFQSVPFMLKARANVSWNDRSFEAPPIVGIIKGGSPLEAEQNSLFFPIQLSGMFSSLSRSVSNPLVYDWEPFRWPIVLIGTLCINTIQSFIKVAEKYIELSQMTPPILDEKGIVIMPGVIKTVIIIVYTLVVNFTQITYSYTIIV